MILVNHLPDSIWCWLWGGVVWKSWWQFCWEICSEISCSYLSFAPMLSSFCEVWWCEMFLEGPLWQKATVRARRCARHLIRCWELKMPLKNMFEQKRIFITSPPLVTAFPHTRKWNKSYPFMLPFLCSCSSPFLERLFSTPPTLPQKENTPHSILMESCEYYTLPSRLSSHWTCPMDPPPTLRKN